MPKVLHPTERDNWIVIYPDDRGPVIIRRRRPWPVPFPDLVRTQDEEDYLAEEVELDMAALPP